MIRNAASKVIWVGRATVFLVGLAVVLALLLGLASAALGATGGNFVLGRSNVATTVSKLTANIAAPALRLVNTSTGAAATALNLTVASGKPPLTVNAAAGKATNLDADKLDGKDSANFVQGRGKAYVGRVVVPTSNPFPNESVLTVPGFATVRAQNCQSGGANVSLEGFDQTRGTLSVWRDAGAADPNHAVSPPLSGWSSNFQATERTTWHLSVGTGSSAEATTIDVYTQVDGGNCVYSATAQVWGR